ncbi:hypothetical protein Tco_0826253, partial [Tanacetum coccineum]
MGRLMRILCWDTQLIVKHLGNQTNGNAGTKESIDADQDGKKTIPSHEYILLPLWTPDSPISSSPKRSDDEVADDAGKKSTKDPANEGDKDDQDLRDEFERLFVQGKEAKININNTNSFFAVRSPINTAGTKDADDEPMMNNLEEIVYTDDDEDVGAEADMTNLDTHIPVSLIPTTKIHKDHPVEQIIGDIHSAPQTRRVTKSVTGHDPSWIEAMQDELLQFKLQQVWTLVDLPYGKRAIRTKWIYRNKKDERASTPMESSKPLIKDENAKDVDVYLYRSMIGSLMYLTSSRPDIMFADLPFDLEAYTESNYASASLDRKSTTGEYVAASNYYRQVLWIQNQLLDYGYNFMNTKIFRDSNEKKLIQMIKIYTVNAAGQKVSAARQKVNAAGLNKAVHEERGDSVERAATTAASLDTEQDSGDNTPKSDDERIELKELIDMYIKLSDRVLDLENVKDAQALEIKKLKKRVKKLERKNKSRTPQPKRRVYKPRVESSKESLGEKDASKQGRNSDNTEELNVAKDEHMFDLSDLAGTEVVLEEEPIELVEKIPVKDKGKGIMQEPEKPVKVKGKDQIKYDADVAQRLQAELDEEARLKREREEEASNVAL